MIAPPPKQPVKKAGKMAKACPATPEFVRSRSRLSTVTVR
jgi:hypothetical protein